MVILFWIILGLFIGTLGHLLDRQQAKGGLLGALLFGVTGSLTGGLVAQFFFGSSFQGAELSTFLIVLSGSLFLLLIQRTVFTKAERF